MGAAVDGGRSVIAIVFVALSLLLNLSTVPCVAVAAAAGATSGGGRSALDVSPPGRQHEFCQNEQFRAACRTGSDSSETTSVIVMKYSRYGRMEINRCVQKNYGYIGCGVDSGDHVLSITDRMCSGRRNCTINVPNVHLDEAAKRANCPDDFKSYLDVSYECLDVHPAPRHGCRTGGPPPPTIIAHSEGVLASVVTLESECGSHHSPWRLVALPGQRFNFTLIDFAHQVVTTSGVTPPQPHGPSSPVKSASNGGQASSAGASPTVCYAYAVFREGGPDGAAKTHTQCGSMTGERESPAYTSTTEKVQITIMSRSPDSTKTFLIKYNVLGCGTPVAPPGGWVRRINADHVTFGCNDTSLTWAMTCSGTKWAGSMYNCTIPENSLGLIGNGVYNRLSFELAFIAVVFIALIIAGVILCIGVVWIRRQSRLYGSASTTNSKLERCLELHAPVDANTGGPYGVRSTTAPYGPPFRSVLAGAAVPSNYNDSGIGGGGYDPSAAVVPRTPSDFYRAGSSSNDYAYIQETSTPPPLPTTQTGITASSFAPRRNFGVMQMPQTGSGSSVLLDGSADVSAGSYRAPYSTLERSDSLRSGQQLLQHQPPIISRANPSAFGVDQWGRPQRATVSATPFLASDDRCNMEQ